MKRIVLGIIIVLFMLGMAFSVIASNNAPENTSVYLPFVSKNGALQTSDMTLQSESSSSKLLEVIPLVNNEALLIIQNNENNIVVYKYDAFGASTFVDGWDSGIGNILSVTVKGCVWVVVEREFGINVHKVLDLGCE